MKIIRGVFIVLSLLVVIHGSGEAVEDFQALDTEISSVEERRLIVKFKEQQQKNKQQLVALEKEKIELNLLRTEVDKRLDALTLLRREIQGLLEEKDARELEKVAELSQMYNRMESVRAAQIISELDRELAIGILSGMKAKSAGKVLANIGD